MTEAVLAQGALLKYVELRTLRDLGLGVHTRPSLPHRFTPIIVSSFKTASSTLRMSQICRYTGRHKPGNPASLRHITKKQVRCPVLEK